MKRLKKYTLLLSIFAVTLVSCDSLLDVDSERFLYPDEHQVNSGNDTIYSMVGILSTLQPVANQYVLLGELRGDLMQITDNARLDLQKINEFEFDSSNQFVNQRDYYEVIKHCNYLIHNIDTSVVISTEKVLYKEFAAAKAIRAWVYMQLAINFETVVYIEEPFTSITDVEKDYPIYNLSELAPVLISDLLPWKDTDKPGSISLGADVSSSNSFFPINFILGDLYLWTGNYENAAKAYYELIEENNYRTNLRYRSLWEQDPTSGVWYRNLRWNNIFELNSFENITQIASSNEFGDGAILDSLSFTTYEITPSQIAMNNWADETYFQTANIIREGGDLRGRGSWVQFTSSRDGEMNVIWKYNSMSNEESKALPVYRISMLYSRYAEAVNRLGKPKLAFAVIKQGLTKSVIESDSIVPASEKYLNPNDSLSSLIDYVDFTDDVFDDNRGIHERGSGNTNVVSSFKIPSLATLQDSVEYVEDAIMYENALEFAFEGNRFQDLMRVSLRRNNPSYLADKVSAKYTADRKDAIKDLLMDTQNWYLK